MAIILTDQELINAKRDIKDIGKAVNQKEVVHPRYGDSFKSLPMIAEEFQISSDAAEAAAVSAADSANIAQSSSQIAQDSAALAELSATAATIGGKVYDTPEAGVDPVTGVADGAYFNVRSSSDESYIDEYRNIGGSAVATGKRYLSSLGVQLQEKAAITIKDASGKSQQEVNDNQLSKTYSLKDAGGVGGGANDTAALTSAISSNTYVYLNTGNSIIKQAILNKKVALVGDSNLVQDTAQQHIAIVGFAKGSSGDLNGTLIEDSLFLNTKFGYMPQSSTDDFSAIHVASGDNTRTVLSSFNTSETGTTFCATDAKFAKPGWGSIDSLALCNSYKNVRRFTVQNLQASYSRIIGISSHNYGDNTSAASGGINAGGFNMGVRLAGICKGNLVSSSNIRDRRSAVEFQIGCKYNVVQGSYFENSYSNAINYNTNNFAVGGSQNISATTIVDSGDAAVRLRYGGHCRVDALIDTTGLTADSAGYGVDAAAMTAGEEHFIIEFNAGGGVVPPTGTVVTQGAASGVLVRVVADSLATIAPSAPMPTAGTILLKSITGGVFKSGALTGISATATRAYAAEGRHRIDVSASNTKSASLRIGTNGNLVDLISTDQAVADLDLSGSYNNVRVVVADNNNNAVYSSISGNNNTVNLVDNCSNTAKTVLLISGNDNTVFVNSKARISISGTGNTVVALVNRVTVAGTNNNIGGNGSIVDVSSGGTNKYTNHILGSIMGSRSGTTNASGELTFAHTLATTAKYVSVEVLDSSELVFARVLNVATTPTTSTIKVYNLDGTPATGKSVSFLYQASC